MRNALGLLTAALALISIACGTSPTAPSAGDASAAAVVDQGNGSGTIVDGQTLALTIDGAAFQPTSVGAGSVPAYEGLPEMLHIFASGPGGGAIPPRGVTIQMPNRVGTYDVGSTYNIGVVIRRTSSPDAYSEAISGAGSGTVEITSRTAHTAEGRVNVTLTPAGQFGGGASTCAGTFSVRF